MKALVALYEGSGSPTLLQATREAQAAMQRLLDEFEKPPNGSSEDLPAAA